MILCRFGKVIIWKRTERIQSYIKHFFGHNIATLSPYKVAIANRLATSVPVLHIEQTLKLRFCRPKEREPNLVNVFGSVKLPLSHY